MLQSICGREELHRVTDGRTGGQSAVGEIELNVMTMTSAGKDEDAIRTQVKLVLCQEGCKLNTAAESVDDNRF